MIPEHERARLRETIAEAWDLAEKGRVHAGYECLDMALACVEALPLDPFTGETQPLEPWEVDLADQYRKALVRYAEACGLTWETPATAVPPLQVRVAELTRRSRELRAHSRRLIEESQKVRQTLPRR